MDLSFDLLAAHVGETFTLVARGSDAQQVEVGLLLRAARPHEADHPGGALEFTGPTDLPLDQGSYRLRHPDVGEGLLFIVPVAQDAEARVYESVFA